MATSAISSWKPAVMRTLPHPWKDYSSNWLELLSSVKMKFLPVQSVPTVPCLLHVTPCKERHCPLCNHPVSTVTLWLRSLRDSPFLPRKDQSFSLSLSLSLLFFFDNWHIIVLVQEAHSEIGSSQSCHKEFELTAILSLIIYFIPPSIWLYPLSLLPVILEIHFCFGIYSLNQGCINHFYGISRS